MLGPDKKYAELSQSEIYVEEGHHEMCKELGHDEMYVKLGHDEGLHMSSGVFCGYWFSFYYFI